MSDFLIGIDPARRPSALLALLQQPYGTRTPIGRSFQHRWGCWALLEDPIAHGRNFIRSPEGSFAWVGDLVCAGDREALHRCLDNDFAGPVKENSERLLDRFRNGSLLRQLNGGFAAVLAGEEFVCVITDPMGAVQVYAGLDDHGQTIALGTHPDLVATCVGQEDRIDPVSVCDFLNTGTPCWPFTMHQQVRELAPGCVHVFCFPPGRPPETREWAYWSAPAELRGNLDENELANEFASRWRKAVAVRSEGRHLGVQLSGGLDSRLIMAAVSPEKHCVGLTFQDTINREVSIARRVSKCYGRDWVPLQRAPEYVGHTAIESTRFTGCEGEWHHAHAIGFADQLRGMNLDGVFSGLFMDNNFKGYYARDLVRLPRMRGLLPAAYEVRPRDYVNRINEFCRRHVKSQLVNASLDRRKQFWERHFARGRESEWEWLDGYPLTQASDNTGWIAERRVMPVRLPVMDRYLVDLAFQIPIRMKAGGRFFLRAARLVLGPGNHIPNANDGAKPGSGAAARFIQRSVRETENFGRRWLGRAGVRLAVPHSWHDYQNYLRESVVLQQLMDQHGDNLSILESDILPAGWRACLQSPDLPWRVGCRIIQLALWLSILRQYKLVFHSQTELRGSTSPARAGAASIC